MAVLDITEYAVLAKDKNGRELHNIGREPAVAHQQVAIAAGSAQSAAFNAQTRFVRIHTDAACRIEFGNNPTAAATTRRMAANATEVFGVDPGNKVAVITSA